MADDKKLNLLKQKLKEIFQYDKSDLDFGVYRIINLKRKEVNDFIDVELQQLIKEKFSELESAEEKSGLEELERLRLELEEALGESIAVLKKNKNPKGKLKEYIDLEKSIRSKLNLEDVEEDIFDRILTFFSRYYLEGDFISKGIYSDSNKYSIPYNGDEVYMHWANKDQYYVKTSEDFRDFKFVENGFEVHFKIKQEDVDVEQNNNKSNDKKAFVYLNHELKGKVLVFNFGFRALTGSETKELEEITDYNKVDNKSVLQYNLVKMKKDTGLEKVDSDLLFLNQPYKNKINGEDNGKTVLGWYLNKYITKNTSDYFIHKDLKGFLLRELDFYIKNEMFNIDKVEDEDELRFNLRKIRTFKSISKKIIEFLAQIEEFQKRLWEKKKFVVSTDYCITLDYIDEKNYPEVLKNSLQIEEWKRLGFVEGKVDVKFLKENSTLNIDTKFFDVDFKYQILSEIEDLEENTNGVLINSENFQALNLMLEKYREKIKCCYIDPPYNTVHSEILYKNNFKHSSWLSLLNNSVPLSKEFLMPISSFGFAIDDYELHNALLYLNQEFCDYEISVIIVNHHPQGSGGKLSRTHEYYIVCSTKKFSPLLGKEKERYEEDRSFMRSGTGENNYRIGRWRSFYALLYDPKTNKIIDAEEPVPLGNIIPKEDKNCLRRIYPINSREEERVWRSSYETGKKRAQNGELFLSQRGAVYQALVHDEKREVLFSNWMDSKFNAGQHGSALLSSLGLGDKFDYPKSINTMELGITAQTELDKSASILDFFAGSGTTGHAVLKLNKEDEGNRKFILVEMGEYFDTVTKPRIQKVIFSDNWKNGKPQDNNGSKKQIIKYQSLEQYEDTLNNIDFSNPSQETLKVKDYKIKYMLNIESRDNNVFMNLENLENPFNYKLIINGKETTIDLVETFNYLAGLKVSKISKQTHKKTDYIIVRGKRKNKDVVVFWRNIKDLNKTEDKAFIESQINDENEIFVNSDSLVRNAKPVDLILKEELFGGI